MGAAIDHVKCSHATDLQILSVDLCMKQSTYLKHLKWQKDDCTCSDHLVKEPSTGVAGAAKKDAEKAAKKGTKFPLLLEVSERGGKMIAA